MRKQWVSKRRAQAYSLIVFFIGLGIISIIDNWWPSFALVIGISLAVRQILLRKFYEMCVSIIVFGGLFLTNHFKVTWKVVLPVIFFTSALFVLLREYVDTKLRSEDQFDEDSNHEIEEEQAEEHTSSQD